MSLGADLFLVKPTEPTVFMDHVRDVLSQKRDGKLPAKIRVAPDTPFLQQYSQVLVHKLEDKLA